ncbi:hypothetical protein [Vibrio tapetis]|uniref:Uncharacterized protein n=1 Tax=Vibrio tapetis subsp. tapetis TaxID=1671868 RepID=A0A2N8Z8D0_9VIBR|nr:hypothetical protein [Vibrio tapetis]SON48150.1 protein of unknown function [Vibrio tapetis subsp. tapetis]
MNESLNLRALLKEKALIASTFYQHTTAELTEAFGVVKVKEVQHALKGIYLSWYAQK